METNTTPTTLSDKITIALPKLARIAARYATANVSADDILQTSIEKILATCKATDTTSYLCQLTKWTALNMLNAGRIYTEYVTQLGGNVEQDGEELDYTELFADGNSINPENKLVELETAEEVRKLMNDLKPIDNLIIKLLLDGNTREEIAEEVGMTYGAVKARIQRLRGVFELAGITPALT